jgi:elongation factor G
MAIAEAGAGRSDVPRFDRSGNRPDHSFGHGRAAPGNHRRPHDARVRRGRQRGQAAGGLSRDHPQDAEYDYTHKKQTGGSGQYARVSSCASSPAPGQGLRVRQRDRRRQHSEGIHPGVEKGVKEALEGGILAGYPDVGRQGHAVRRRYHDVDSSEMAFKICARLRQGSLPKAKPVLLEPIMAVEVVVPEEYMGPVIGDLNSRRGQMEGMEMRGNHADHQGDGAAVGDVRLRDRAALAHAGPRQFHHALSQYEEVPKHIAERS